MPQPIQIQLLSGPGTGRQASFTQSPITFGRDNDNTLVIADQFASRKHGEIRWEKEKWVLVNHSPNGTRVNRRRVRGKPRPLRQGDVLAVSAEPLFRIDLSAPRTMMDADVPVAKTSAKPIANRKAKLWMTIGIWWAVVLGLIAIFATFIAPTTTLDPHLAEMNDAQIAQEIRKPLPNQPPDAIEAARKLKEANDFAGSAANSPTNAFLSYQAFRQALSLLNTDTFNDPVDNLRFQEIKGSLTRMIIERFHAAYSNYGQRQWKPAIRDFDQIMKIFADPKSEIYKNAMEHANFAQKKANVKQFNMTQNPANLAAAPDAAGHFGQFGGSFVPETLVAAITQLRSAYEDARNDPAFAKQLQDLLTNYVGRPTPLYFCRRLTELAGGARIYLKREDLAHTGAHKINNALGQGLLTLRMDKKRIIAETGAGQHGVATATAAAVFGLSCDVYMGSEDMRRQRPNVLRMGMLGTRVVPVESGSRTLKDATNAAMRDWMESSDHTHYIIGSVVGPHPFPMIVRDFQAVIGIEARRQSLEQIGRLPDAIYACVGGGSNAAGIFHPFINDAQVKLIGIEAGGRGTKPGDNAASINFGKPGVLHGSLSYVLQDPDGQTADVHSISAGLDYPGVGPEHAYWHDTKRVLYTYITDRQALDALSKLTRYEGIIPALESSHALAQALIDAAKMKREQAIIVNLSGRGDKDLDEVVRLLGEK